MKKQEHQEDQDQQKMSQTDSPVEGEDVAATDTGEEGAGTQEDPLQKLEQEKAALEEKNKELHNQYLMAMADFDNYRKRMIKEKQETYDYANAALLSDLLDSLDNFDRTIDAAKDAKDAKSIADGIKMINNSLVKMLEDKYGLVGYGKEDDEFNPDEHEAIGRMEDEKAKKETLAQVYLKGYKLKDKVIRHAKVMVKVPKA